MASRNRSSVTSYDVARLAGVSQSAVSRCYTPGATASPEMRRRVAEAADRLGWQPRSFAPVATSGRSRLIAVIVAELTSAAYPELLFALSRAFADRGLSVVLVSVADDAPLDFLEPLVAHGVDGVVVATNLAADAIAAIRAQGLPLLLYNRVMPRLRLPAVSCDHVACGRLLADHLLDLGHRRFGLVGASNSVVGDGRIAGMIAALADAGVEPAARSDGDFSYASGVAACARLCADAAPTAILCANDAMAAGVIDGLRLRGGRAVPGEVSVAGIDGADVGSWLPYRLTTVRQPVALLGAAAAELMLTRIGADDRFYETRLFAGELVVGESTAAP